MFTADLVQLQRVVKNGHAGDLFFVRITADLEVDAPKVLKSYAQRYGADFQNWAFLTGIEPELGGIPVAFLDTFKDGVLCATSVDKA